MTEADARNIILQAKQHAYGAQHVELTSRIVEINQHKFVNDPTILMLRAYANHEDTTQYFLERANDTPNKLDRNERAVSAARADQAIEAANAEVYSSAESGEVASQKDDDDKREKYMTAGSNPMIPGLRC